MRTVVLVPRRAGIPERDAIWAWCRSRWETDHPDLPIYEGHHDEGPFNRSAAINRAAFAAGAWDLAVIIDADVFLDPANVRAAIERAASTNRVTWAFTRWSGLTQDATRALIGAPPSVRPGGDLERIETASIEKTNPISWSCCFVVPRAVWDDLGGFDERFAGWGWEDMAWQSAVVGLHGYERLEGDVYHLWHPRHPGLGTDGERKRRNRQLGRRYMYAVRRDYGWHDRDNATEAEREKDQQNLLRLMEQEETIRGKPAPDLPDWRDWLPTLEELVESWKAGLPAGPPPPVLFLVRSGGTAEAWPTRREYLRTMLASLEANVRYEPIAARVVFSDWPAEVQAELAAIVEPHGFYVVGRGNDGFTASMQRLWAYLSSRRWRFDYVFLVEDDFEFTRAVELHELVEVLATHPHLVQVALLRDACYPAERERGGVLGHPWSEFSGHETDDGLAWLEHRRFFTLNPTLIRRSLIANRWPSGRHSEAIFGRELFADPNARSALWGSGESWIRHLGEVRAGAGY